MFSDRGGSLKEKAAGAAIALGIQGGFMAALVIGLSVTVLPKIDRPILVDYRVVKKPVPPPPEPPAQPLQPVKPFDYQPPIVDDRPDPVIRPDPVPEGPVSTGPIVEPTPRIIEQPPQPPPVVRTGAAPDPRYLALLQPDYPPSAARAEEEGVVVLRVLVGTDGRIREAQLFKSSGSDSLDQAAIRQALKKWRFTPATENGAPVESWMRVPVRFELKRA